MRQEDARGGLGTPDLAPRESKVLEAVRDAIRQIEYGSVLIKIHQGDVVGIETSTKLRFGDQPPGS